MSGHLPHVPLPIVHRCLAFLEIETTMEAAAVVDCVDCRVRAANGALRKCMRLSHSG